MLGLTTPEIIGGIALLISLYGSIVYIVSILRGQSKPHLFTWLVWGIIATIGYAAQIHDHAGPGSWTLAMTAVSCLITAALSLKYGEKTFTRGDKIALGFSLSAIIPWLITKDPLGSVILISLIDIVAFYPTFRKSWVKPYEENLTSYNLHTAKMVLSMLALVNVTLNTALYPAVFVTVNLVFTAMCLIRRRQLSSSAAK